MPWRRRLALGCVLLAALLASACGSRGVLPTPTPIGTDRPQLRIDVPNGPAVLSVAPSATRLYVGTYRDAEVIALDAQAGTVLWRAAVPGGRAVTAIDTSDDGRWVYAATSTGHLAKIDASAGTVARYRMIGGAPFALAASGTSHVVITDPTSTSLRVVSSDTLADSARVELAAHALDLVVDAPGRRAFVTVQDGTDTQSGGVLVVELDRMAVVARQPIERATRVAHDARTSQLLVMQRTMTSLPAGGTREGGVVVVDDRTFAVKRALPFTNPSSLALDPLSGAVVVGDERDGVRLFKSALSASGVPLPNVGRPTALGASSLAGYVYVADGDRGAIVFAPLAP